MQSVCRQWLNQNPSKNVPSKKKTAEHSTANEEEGKLPIKKIKQRMKIQIAGEKEARMANKKEIEKFLRYSIIGLTTRWQTPYLVLELEDEEDLPLIHPLSLQSSGKGNDENHRLIEE
jgi:hypothetical protein